MTVMNTRHKNIDALLHTLNDIKIMKNPLPIHYLVDNLNNHDRQIYANLIGNILLSNDRITESDQKLFKLWLISLDINTQMDKYLSILSTAEVTVLLDKLDNGYKKRMLLFDALLFIRCGSAATSDQLILISELADILALTHDNVAYTLYWVGKLLGLDIAINQDNKKISKREKSSISIESETLVGSFLGKNATVASYRSISSGRQYFSSMSTFSSNSALSLSKIKSIRAGFLLNTNIDKNNHYHYEIVPLPKELNNWVDTFKKLYQ